MKYLTFPICASICLGIVLMSTAAHADKWSYTVSHKYTGKTSIRIEKPAGFSAEVEGKRDTLPAIFSLPDKDAFVLVTVTAKDGNTWQQKIEVKNRNQTNIDLSYQEQATPASSSKSYAGRFDNTVTRCKDAKSRHLILRFRLFRDGQEVGRPVIVKPGRTVEATLPGGNYLVRVDGGNGRRWIFFQEFKQAVESDGWVISSGC